MDQVRTFATTLLEKNKVMNLTGALTVDEVLGRHVADLALIPAIERALDAGASSRHPGAKIRVMDVGSGAGFRHGARHREADVEVTLLDTLQKRTSFLDAAAAECGADNVRTLWSRAEDAGKSATGTGRRTTSSPRAPSRSCESSRSCACRW